MKSPNLDFVEVTPRGHLRVLHVLPFESTSADQLDGAVTSRSEGSDVPTNDFWFNHWQVRLVSLQTRVPTLVCHNVFGLCRGVHAYDKVL